MHKAIYYTLCIQCIKMYIVQCLYNAQSCTHPSCSNRLVPCAHWGTMINDTRKIRAKSTPFIAHTHTHTHTHTRTHTWTYGICTPTM